jgi:hypothetical protein
MSNTNILELRTLDDEELMDIVGGCQPQCAPRPRCQPRCQPCGGIDIDIDISVSLCL